MKQENDKPWETYEHAACNALRGFISVFKLDTVNAKQCLTGKSGTQWEVDAVARNSSTNEFFIVECRRYSERSITQEAVGGVAYKMKDVGAAGALIVSTKGLQKGAATIAKKENIHFLKLSAESTPELFTCAFQNIVAAGIKDSVSVSYGLEFFWEKPHK